VNSTRQFLKIAIESGIETGMVAPADVLRHATPDVLASSLPAAQTAKLLKASLAAASMDPQLVVDTLGIDTLAEHLPTNVLWACLADQAGKALGNTATVADATPAPAPAKAAAKPAAKPAKAAKAAKAAAEPDKPVAKPQAKVTRAKTKPPPAPGSKAARRSDRRPARLKPRSPTSSDFDVDTDVGEEWPSDRGNGEAESLGAAPLADDWQKSEETATKNVVDPTATGKG
jgi:hypothetical protein